MEQHKTTTLPFLENGQEIVKVTSGINKSVLLFVYITVSL